MAYLHNIHILSQSELDKSQIHLNTFFTFADAIEHVMVGDTLVALVTSVSMVTSTFSFFVASAVDGSLNITLAILTSREVVVTSSTLVTAVSGNVILTETDSSGVTEIVSGSLSIALAF